MTLQRSRSQRSKMVQGSFDQGDADPAHKDPFHSGFRKFGRYVDGKLIGKGGMGAVFRAKDEHLGRIVAVKILPLEKAKNPILVKRFQAEGRAAASLDHANIIRVYDSGEIDGHLFIAMEFIDGMDLAALVDRDGPITPEKSVDIIKQVVEALKHAFDQQIVHRDIKPSNLMIDGNGHVKLADMGLARSLGETESASITRAGTTVGTVDYMAPEQARDSKRADIRSDVYSLGATWFYMLVAQPPFTEGDLLNKLNAHAHDPRPDPRPLLAALAVTWEIPKPLVDILQRMMAISPDERYQTPHDLADDLQRLNLDEREINLNVIAGLAGASDDAPATSQKRSHAFLDDEDMAPLTLKSPTKRSPKAAPSKPDRKAGDRQRTVKAPAETVAERSSSTRSVPTPREVSPKVDRKRHRQVKVEFDQRQLIKLAVMGIGIVVVVMLAWSAFQEARKTLTQPSPNVVSPSIETPVLEPDRNKRPKKSNQ